MSEPAATPEVSETPEDISIESDLEVESEGSQELSSEQLSEQETEEPSDSEVAEMIKTLKLKVDGEIITEELPFEVSPEHAEYLQKQLQLAKMAQKRAQETAELRKLDQSKAQQVEEFLAALKGNTKGVLEEMGLDVREFAEKVLEEEVQRMEMSEEERKILDLQEQLKKHQEKEEEAQRKAELAEQERVRDQYAAQYEKDLMSAINDNAMMNDPEIISRMTNLMRIALQNGIDLSFNDLAPIVEEEINASITKLARSKSPEQILKLLTEDQIKSLISSQKPKKEAPPTASSIKDTGAKAKKDDGPVKKTVSMNDFFKNL